MPSAPFDAPDWLRALTLAERAGLRARLEVAAPSSRVQEEAASFRLREWKAQPPFDQGDWLALRLAGDGLDEGSFSRIIHAAPDALKAALRGSPAWLEELSEAFAAAREPEVSLDLPEEDAGAGFLALVKPLVDRAIRRLAAGITPLARSNPSLVPDPVRTAAELAEVLPGRLLPILDRTLVLELNVARLEGLLTGQTPEARFREFVERLRNRETALALLAEYPVLARLVVETLDRWVTASLEFVARLASDAGSIRSTFFGGEDPGALSRVSGGAGDPHHEGRTVLIPSFASGARLVYKPRPLAVDVHFQAFLRWLDAKGNHLPFRTLKVLDMGRYGWIEFVEPAGCHSMEQIRLYHERLGGLMAVLYVLEATDLHFENLIASGDQPVPIDLESILHPRPPLVEPLRPDERLAGRLLSHSVLRIGLLPFRVGEGDDFAGADLSGVASVGGQATPERILRWEGTGTDQMHAVRERMTMSAGLNRPTLEGREVEVSGHSDEIARGFEEVYRLLLRHRDELLSTPGPLDAFRGDEVRAVLRPTRAYGLLLEESYHPDFLRDALDRDRFLDRLWVGVDDQPAYARVAGFEHRDLLAGDIPYFSARPAAIDAWASRGEGIERFFETSPLDVVRERLASMGEEDLRRQLWLVRTSLGTRLMGRTDDGWAGYAPVEAPPHAGSGEIRSRSLEAAGAVGEWFERMAVRDDEFITWVALDLRDEGWSLVPISEDLYAGSPGISLFLAHLGALTGESRYTGMAKAAARTLLARLNHVADSLTGIGAFQGWGGILYTLAHLGALWNDEELLRSSESMVARVEAIAIRDEDLDVVAGAAGALFALLAVHAATGSARALAAAVRCGERLLATGRPSPRGLAWHTRIGPGEPQTGFSHGAAGIALALAELAAATGDDRFGRAALAGFALEREILWPRIRGWVDQEASGKAPEDEPPSERIVAMAWCYGAPGIGLSRLRALRHADDAALRGETLEAVRLTIERGFGKNHCLCHGDLGNLDFVSQAAAALGGEELEEHARRLARLVLAGIERDGWICGTPWRVEAPGLMNGLAGIGLGLLRLAFPGSVPSVLVLEPPRARG